MTDIDQEMELSISNKCEETLSLEFNNLKYAVPGKKGEGLKYVLKDLSGTFQPGKLTAILGPSGAGKSSLLNVLSGFKKRGVSGDITVNGQPRNLRLFKRQACYIEQDMALLPLLTLRETLKVSADLKLGRTVSNFKKNIIVNEILKRLGLEESSNTLVKHLSGGEKKRLAVGVELITNPPIMLFDEPTSGIDISSSIQLVQHLKLLARGNRVIVCVIHQPSSVIFKMFDEAIILAEGEIMYSGPVADVVPSFSKAGHDCPNYYNPADFVIEICKSHPGLRVNHNTTHKIQNGIAHPEKNGHQNNSHKGDDNHICHKTSTDDNHSFGQETGFFYQSWILLKRSITIARRDLFMTYSKLLMTFVTSLFIGVLWYDVGNDADKVLSNIPMLFLSLFSLYAMTGLVMALYYENEAKVVTREYKNNWYSLRAYAVSKLISQLPLQLSNPTIFLIPMYFMSGQPLEIHRILKFWLILFLMNVLGESHGISFGALFKPEVALNVLFGMTVCFLFLSGFAIRLNDIPWHSKWFSEINFLKFAYEGVLRIVYGSDREAMDCNLPYCYFKSPRKVLEETHMTDDSMVWDALGLLSWIIFFQFLFYFALRLNQRRD